MAQEKLFWGMQVASGINYVQKVNQSFVIRQAVLEPDNYVPGATQRVKLIAKYENVEFLLCVLSSSLENTPCQVPLEVKFEKGADLALRIEGSHHATVHLTGYSITETSPLGSVSGTKRCHSCSLTLPVGKKRKLDADVDFTGEVSSDDGVSTIVPRTSALKISPASFQRPVGDRLDIESHHLKFQPTTVASNIEWAQRLTPAANTSQKLATKTRASTRGSKKWSEIIPRTPESEPDATSDKDHDVSVISVTTPTGRKSRARTGKSQSSKPVASPGRMPAVTGKGGIRIQDLAEGEGPIARMGDIVSIHCTGRVGKDVTPFYQETSQQGLTFKLGANSSILQALHIGVEGMRVGGQRKLNIPADQAKTAPGPPLNIPSNAKGIVMFDVELKNVS